MSVLLPAPLSPMIATSSPGFTVSEHGCRIVSFVRHAEVDALGAQAQARLLAALLQHLAVEDEAKRADADLVAGLQERARHEAAVDPAAGAAVREVLQAGAVGADDDLGVMR